MASEYGADRVRRDHLGMRMTNPRRDAQNARRRAAMTRAETDELRSLPVNEAARRIETKHAEQRRQNERGTSTTRLSVALTAAIHAARGRHADCKEARPRGLTTPYRSLARRSRLRAAETSRSGRNYCCALTGPTGRQSWLARERLDRAVAVYSWRLREPFPSSEHETDLSR